MNNNNIVQVDLHDAEWRTLVEHLIEQTFLPESLQTFREALDLGKPFEEACYDALRNEGINHVLVRFAEEEKDQHGTVADLSSATQPSKMIWVTFQKEGIHLYPAAATDPRLKTGGWDDVSFLGVPHRHIFHFRVSLEVVHSDRDVEFIQFKRWLERLYSEGTLELNHKSCEMIAEDLAAVIKREYPNRDLVIEVSEDGENGATLTFPK